MSQQVSQQRREISSDIERQDEVGEATRATLTVLDIDAPDARNLYARKLVFVRPDQHVAWRGDEQPAVPMDLIELVRGARRASACKTA